jgi:hypothetical protein
MKMEWGLVCISLFSQTLLLLKSKEADGDKGLNLLRKELQI